jgi:hypothetical protein
MHNLQDSFSKGIPTHHRNPGCGLIGRGVRLLLHRRRDGGDSRRVGHHVFRTLAIGEHEAYRTSIRDVDVHLHHSTQERNNY